PSRVTDAMTHWEAKTRIRFVPRTNESAYTTFTTGTGCSSTIGRWGTQQFVKLASNCGLVAIIHEIGHTVGLYHEQCRADRDSYVKILTQNIESKYLTDFNIVPNYEVGTYHYDSVMHYQSMTFSKNGSPTITMLDGGLILPNKTGLVQGDIDHVALIY